MEGALCAVRVGMGRGEARGRGGQKVEQRAGKNTAVSGVATRVVYRELVLGIWSLVGGCCVVGGSLVRV